MSGVDPGLVAERLRRAGEGIAEARFAVETVAEALDTPIRETEVALAQGQRETTRAANLVEDVAGRQGELAASVEGACSMAAGLAAAVDDSRLHAEQLTALVDRTRAKWEAELAARQREADELRARRGTAKRTDAARIQARATALDERIRCAQDALARCREAAGTAAQAGLAARRADEDLQASLGRIEEAETCVDRVTRQAQEATTRVDAGRQAVLAGSDRLSFAKRSQQETAEAALSLSECARRAERGLADASDRLRRVDRGGPR